MADYEISVGVKPDYSGLDALEQRIKSTKHEIEVGVNTKGATTNIRGVSTSIQGVATDVQRLSNSGSLQKWYDNNTRAAEKYGKSMKQIIAEYDNLNKPMSKQRYNQLRKEAQLIKNNAYKEGLIGKIPVEKTVTDLQRLTKVDSLQKWADNNTRAMKKYGVEYSNIISKYNNLGKKMTQKESDDLLAQASAIKNKARSEGLLGLTFSDKMKNAWSKFGQWGLATASITTAVRQVSKAAKEVVEIDNILTEISKTSDLTMPEIKKIGDRSFGAASRYGRTASDYLVGVQEMSRSGFYGAKAEGMAEQSLLAQAAGDLDADLANSYILATNAAYKYNGEISKINAALDGQNMITNRNSVSMTDMTEAMTRSASVAASYGVTIEDLSAMIGTIEATTKSGGSVTGNAIKSLLINLQNVTSGKIKDTLESAGAPMTEFINGVEKLRNPIDILKDLSKTFNTLDDDDPLRSEILTNIGQKYHANKLAALLENMDMFDKMVVDYSEGGGSALIEAEKSANNVQGRLNALSNTWTAAIESLLSSDLMKGGINLANGLLGGVGAVLKGVDFIGGSFGGAGLATGLYMGINNLGLFKTSQDAYGYNTGFVNPFKKDANGVSAYRANMDAGQGLFYSLFQSDKISQKDVGYIKQYATAVDGGTRYMKNASKAAKKYVLEAKKSGKSKEEILAGLEEMPKAFSFKSFGQAALRTLGSTALTMGASVLIDKAVEGVKYIVNYRDNTMQAGAQARSEIDNMYSQYKQKESSATSLGDTYFEYAKKVDGLGTAGQNRGSLTNKEYSEFLDTSSQLVQLFPQLLKTFDNNGNPILNIKPNDINTAIRNEAISTSKAIDDKMGDTWKAYMTETYGETDYWGSYTTHKDYDGLDDKSRLAKELSDITTLMKQSPNRQPTNKHKSFGVDFSSDTLASNFVEDLYDRMGFSLYNKFYKGKVENTDGTSTATFSYGALSASERQTVDKVLGVLATEYKNDATVYGNQKIQKDKEMASYIDKALEGNIKFMGLSEEESAFYKDFLYNSDWINKLPDNVKAHDWESVKKWINESLIKDLDFLDEGGRDILAKATSDTASVNELFNLQSMFFKKGYRYGDPIYDYIADKTQAESTRNQRRNVLSKSAWSAKATDDERDAFIKSLSDEELEVAVQINAEKGDLIDDLSEFEFELGKVTNDFSRTSREEAQHLLDGKLSEYKGILSELDELSVGDKDYAAKVESLLGKRESLGIDIRQLEELIRKSNSLEYAYAGWQESLETENSGAEYEAITSYIETAKELKKQGLIGIDDFQSFAQMISPEELSGATAFEIAQAFEKALPTVEKYFSEGKEGCDKLLKDMKNLNSEAGKFAEYDPKTGLWSTNFNAQDLMDNLGLSQPMAEAAIERLEDYGHNVYVPPVKSSIDKLKSEYDESVEVLQKHFEGTEYEVDLSFSDRFSSDVDALEGKIQSLKTAYDSFYKKDELGNVTTELADGINTEAYAAAQTAMATLMRQRDELSMNPVELEFTFKTADSPEKAAAALIEDLKSSIADYNLADALNLDTKEFEGKIQEISGQLNTLFEENEGLAEKFSLDTTTMEALSNLSKIDLSNLGDLGSFNMEEFNANIEAVKTAISNVDETMYVNLQLKEGATSNLTNALPKDESVTVGVQYDDPGFTPEEPDPVTVTVQYDDPGFTPPEPAPIHVAVIYDDPGFTPKGGGNPKTNQPKDDSSTPKGGGGDNTPTLHFDYDRNWYTGKTKADGNANELTLGGELGQELVVRDGRFFTIGDESAEFFDYKEGDIVFNAEQTKQLLSKGKISSGSRRGKAFAWGHATNAGGVSSQVMADVIDEAKYKVSRRYSFREHDDEYIAGLEDVKTKVQSEKEKLEMEDEIIEALKKKVTNKLTDIEHANTLLESVAGNEDKIIENLVASRDIVHEEAERYRQYLRDNWWMSEEEIANNSYIQELQEKYLEISDRIIEINSDAANAAFDKLESQIELNINRGDTSGNKSLYEDIMTLAHEQAEYFRAIDPEKYAEEIREWGDIWWDARNSLRDESLDDSKNWIERRNTYNDWSLFGDSEIKAWERVVGWLNKDYPEAIEDIAEAEEKLFEARKDEFSKANDLAESYLDSQKTLLQSHYDVTNAIAEARYEINKELEVSKTMYEYLDEETRELLFNQEDFNKLSSKLNSIEKESLNLKANYEKALNEATLENVESVTSEYEMQYELLMKNYEIAKADLEVAKKKAQLNNVLNERNVRMFVNGSWQWVANTEAVSNAKSELADAEYAQRIADSGLEQQKSMDEITKRQDELGVVIKKFENGVITLDDAVELAGEALVSLPKELSKMYGNVKSSSSSGGSKNYSTISYNDAISIMKSNSAKWESASESERGDLHSTNQRLGDSLGLTYDSGSGKWKKPDGTNAYATGTKYTQGGWSLLGEEESEIYINSNGRLIPINQPTMGNLKAGGVVFNQKQMESVRQIWDWANLGASNIGALYSDGGKQNVSNVDNRIIINGMTVDSGSSDGQALIGALRRYVGNH